MGSAAVTLMVEHLVVLRITLMMISSHILQVSRIFVMRHARGRTVGGAGNPPPWVEQLSILD
jgi:hypothetical protein